MMGLDRIRRYMAEVLTAGGVAAVTAWPGGAAPRTETPVAAVSLRSCTAGPGGFCDYLGERFDDATGRWQELYGRRVKAVFGLDLYAGRDQGEAGCQAAFDRMAEALGSSRGLRVRTLERGAVAFDRGLERYRCPVEAEVEVWLYATADEDGAFLDFMVKGEVNGQDGT